VLEETEAFFRLHLGLKQTAASCAPAGKTPWRKAPQRRHRFPPWCW
jgi:hypothetical protein